MPLSPLPLQYHLRVNRPGRVVLLCGFALACLAAGGCGRAPRGSRTAAGPSPRPTAAVKDVEIREDPVKTGVAAGDAALAGQVRARLAGEPLLRTARIEVDAEAGRVTLWGHAASAEQRAAAADAARRSRGVTSVVNLVKVDERPGG